MWILHALKSDAANKVGLLVLVLALGAYVGVMLWPKN